MIIQEDIMGTSRATEILQIVFEGKGKPPPESAMPPAPTYDSRAEADKVKQIAAERKALIQKDIAKLLGDIRGRHPKPSSGAPIGGILPPARMR
jgi:hypothetical protein